MFATVWHDLRHNWWVVGVAFAAAAIGMALTVAVLLIAVMALAAALSGDSDDSLGKLLVYGLFAFTSVTFATSMLGLLVNRLIVEACRPAEAGFRAAVSRAFEGPGRSVAMLMLGAFAIFCSTLVSLVVSFTVYNRTDSFAAVGLASMLFAPLKLVLAASIVIVLAGGRGALKAHPARWLKLLGALLVVSLVGAISEIEVAGFGPTGARFDRGFASVGIVPALLSAPFAVLRGLLIGWFMFGNWALEEEAETTDGELPDAGPLEAAPAAW